MHVGQLSLHPHQLEYRDQRLVALAQGSELFLERRERLSGRSVVALIRMRRTEVINDNPEMLYEMDAPPPPDAIKGAVIMVATVPILFVYPFIQKYFVRGVLLGSVKG